MPSNLKPYVFTNLAWDNIDRLEEILLGKGTTHHVNDIAVQAKMFGPCLPTEQWPSIPKLKQRSIRPEQEELPVYYAGEWCGLLLKKTLAPGRDQYTADAVAHKKNLLRVISRLSVTIKKTPSWARFNILRRSDTSVSVDVVAYLLTINDPATELSTVVEILRQFNNIREKLHLTSIVVVFNQALYLKAVEIAW